MLIVVVVVVVVFRVQKPGDTGTNARNDKYAKCIHDWAVLVWVWDAECGRCRKMRGRGGGR